MPASLSCCWRSGRGWWGGWRCLIGGGCFQDAVLEQPTVDVVLPLAAASFLDDEGNVVVGSCHGSGSLLAGLLIDDFGVFSEEIADLALHDRQPQFADLVVVL